MDTPSWPADPYKGLANYECEDQRLFAGRDAEIDTCAQLLANAQTKLLVLHGQTGCGKSSFLRAGLIPALEQYGAGYLFLRRPSANDPGRLVPSFIRCGANPLARIAEEIFLFTKEALSVPTATGVKRIDISAARLQFSDLDAFVAECANPHRLFMALELLTDAVPHTLVLVVDQVEEIITLNSSDKDNRLRFSRFIKELATSDIDMRFVLAIRKDHSGQFIESVQVGNEMSAVFRTFFLAELSRDGIRDAILRPTLDTLPKYGMLSGPREWYQFQYAPGVVDRILKDLDELGPSGATLPVMQIVCRDLYRQVSERPAPRIIGMQLYEEGGVKGRVKRHLVESLRAVLIEHKSRGAGLAQAGLKWLRVLKGLVQEESDGSVHTNVVPRNTLAEWAAREKIEGDIGPVIDKLADPKVLILRRLAVFAPDGGAEHELFCLGHDMVGIALRGAWRDAEEKQNVSGIERKKWKQFVLVVLALLVVGPALLRLNARRVQKVGSLLTQSSLIRSTNVLQALAIAREAQTLPQYSLNDDERPRRAIAAMLSGLPTIIATWRTPPPLSADEKIYPTYALDKRIGLVTLRSRGTLETYTVEDEDIHRQTLTTPGPLVAADGKLNLLSLQVSDASTGLLLASYQPVGKDEPGSVIAFSRSGASRLIDRDDIIDALRQKTGPMSASGLFGLSGDRIVLFAPDRNTSMHLTVVRVTDALRLIPVDLGDLGSFPQSSQLDGGNHVVSYFYAGTNAAVQGIPTEALTGVMATTLSAPVRRRRWDVSAFNSVQKCLHRYEPEQSCTVAAVPDLQQPGLVVLGLWEFRKSRYSSSQRGFVSDLQIIDLEKPVATEINLQSLSAARQTCGIVAGTTAAAPATPAKHKDVLSDDDVPNFVVKSRSGLLLGYASRTAAQLIDASSGSCREIFLPNTQVDGWRVTADGNTLLGLTRDGGFLWDLQPTNDAGSQGVNDRLAQACARRLPLFAQYKVDTTAQAAQRKRLLGQICR